MDMFDIELVNVIKMELEIFVQSIEKDFCFKVNVEDGYCVLVLVYQIIEVIIESLNVVCL